VFDHSHAVHVTELPRRLLVTGVQKGCRLYRVIPEVRYQAQEQRRESVRNPGDSREKLGRAFGGTKSRSRTTVIRKGTSRRPFIIWSTRLWRDSPQMYEFGTLEIVLLFASLFAVCLRRLPASIPKRVGKLPLQLHMAHCKKSQILTKRILPSEEITKRPVVTRWFQLDIRAVADASTKQQAKSQQETKPRCSCWR